MKRKRIWLPAILLILCPMALSVWSRSSQTGISLFVTLHQRDLEQIAADCLTQSGAPDRYRGVRVEGVFPGEAPIVQFSSGGWGLVPSGTYQGFYYSESGQPAAYQNVDLELVPVSDTEWTWTDGTDNGGSTRRISEHWFSYKAWF